MKKIILSIAFVLACVGYAQAETPSRESAQQLVIAMSGEGMLEELVSGRIAKHLHGLKESYPDAAEFWNKFESDYNSQIQEFFTSLYQKHLTQQEADELLAFYSSPLGKKMTKAQYMLASEETVEKAKAWAADFARRLLENQ